MDRYRIRFEDDPITPNPRPGVTVLETAAVEAQPAVPYYVILFNDDVHPIDEVILQVQKAAGVSIHEAFDIVMEAHNHGKAVCYTGDIETCEDVAGVLREIRLTVEIDHYAGV